MIWAIAVGAVTVIALWCARAWLRRRNRPIELSPQWLNENRARKWQ